MKGRPAKDPAVAKLQGNTRRQRKKPAAAAPQKPAEVFFSEWDPPSHLSASAQAVWRELLPTNRRETKLQQSQLPIFALYCAALADWRAYDQAVAKDGAVYTTKSGYRRKTPEVELRAAAAREVARLAEALTLTTKSWASSTGVFKQHQLDLDLHGGGAARPPAPAEAPSAAAPLPPGASEGDIDAFLGRRPTLQ